MLTMTRAEYEATYGVKPVATPASNMDTTPAPRMMTRAEYEAEFGSSQENKNFLTSTDPSFKAGMGGVESVFPNVAKTFGNIPSSARNLARYSIAPVNPFDQGPLNIGKNLYESAGVTKDIFQENGLVGGIKAIGGGVKDVAKKGYGIWKGAGESIYGNLEKNVLAEDSTTKGVGTSSGQALSSIAKLGIEDPLLIPSFLYTPTKVRGTGMTDDLISKTASPITRGKDTSINALRESRQLAKNENLINRTEEEILKIENNYNQTRKALNYSKDEGATSRRRIAESGVLENTVDENGLIRTTQKGGAVDQYKKLTIDGQEGVVRQTLMREGKMINLGQVERELALEMHRTFDGADLISALNGIKKEIQGLKFGADDLGQTPLHKIHDRKISNSSLINYNTPAETSAYRKALSRTFKRLVEENSATNVKQINSELSKYYDDIERLRSLDGKRVKGGKLGKYTAQIAGNIIGGAAGGAVGGLGGTAVGAFVGGETSSFVKGKMMAGTFGKAPDIDMPKNPVLEKAKANASLPPEVNLKVPDKRVGAPKSIKKTPEISKLEAEITKNVRAQELAIKAGDFTLVAKLKEVYNHLVAKLKEVIKTIKETPNREGGFIGGSRSSKSGKSQPEQLSQSLQSSSDTTTSFKNFQDLSTKLLGKLEGRTTVSKQFISDLTNSPDLKQAERDLIRNTLNDFGDNVPVKDFANKVKSELLPLERTPEPKVLPQSEINRLESEYKRLEDVARRTQKDSDWKASQKAYLKYEKAELTRAHAPRAYESTTLPAEIRGEIDNYSEHVYSSPIKTSAGSYHSGLPQSDSYFAHSRVENLPDKSTRRVIEIQSDLFQKGRLEQEGSIGVAGKEQATKLIGDTKANEYATLSKERKSKLLSPQKEERFAELSDEIYKATQRSTELSKLEPYRNTWHERVIREEVKKAAQDGKTKLQFPTGETAMKIEGLGENNAWFDAIDGMRTNSSLEPSMLRPGKLVYNNNGEEWIITDVLGDGKFKAIPKTYYDAYKVSPDKKAADSFTESFDISGKVDTNNPIYKFYEKEVGKYLKNKYNAELVTDTQGVKWWEVKVDKKMAKLPIEAFATAPLLLDNNE